ncbi:MAG: exopolysaccharide biosynthesis polyprenyl glycosylphosphotransferase [Armatimonadetes bacterium]|nr:exopolysaccharide biosynthesis polyprenyl glycosylphosphotransferase [Armatimonadota bacterium]
MAPHPVPYWPAKRVLDFIGALILLVLLFPIFFAIAVAVKITSPGPIFYKSTRVGLCGKKFAFIKFRSMRVDADRLLEQLKQHNEKDGPIFKMKGDPRITPVGRFLRKYSLDELPQLYSVLIGEMSLVGPRPPIPHEVEKYDEVTRTRLSVKPGITCYWQIMGRSNLSFEEWMELDRRYIREMSFWTDVKILLKTPYSVLKGEGAY